MTVRRAFVDGPFGQLHLRMTPPVPDTAPLVCLHGTAYSSQSFLPLMAAFGGRRQVIAVDAPGYGDSAAPAAQIAIAGYADAVAAAVTAATGRPALLLGYHTGAYIAAELAIMRPDLVCGLVLIGVPYFQALDFATWRRKLAARHALGAKLDQFEERWAYLVANRHAALSLPRAFANFVDELKAWPNGWWAHEAMFDYDSDARLPLVPTRTLILNPDGHLAEPSRVAAGLMPDAIVQPMPGVSGPVLEAAPDAIAEAIMAWASAPVVPLPAGATVD